MSRIKVKYDVLPKEKKVKHRVFTPIYKVKEVDVLPKDFKDGEIFKYDGEIYISRITNSCQLDSGESVSIIKFEFNKQLFEKIVEAESKEEYGSYITIYLSDLHNGRKFALDITFSSDGISLYNNDTDESTPIYLHDTNEWFIDKLEFSINESARVDDSDIAFELDKRDSFGCRTYLFKYTDYINNYYKVSNSIELLEANLLRMPEIIGNSTDPIKYVSLHGIFELSNLYDVISFIDLAELCNIGALSNINPRYYVDVDRMFFEAKGGELINYAFTEMLYYLGRKVKNPNSLDGKHYLYVKNMRACFYKTDIEEFDFHFNKSMIRFIPSDMTQCFSRCKNLKRLYNLPDAINLSGVLEGCVNLEELTFENTIMNDNLTIGGVYNGEQWGHKLSLDNILYCIQNCRRPSDSWKTLRIGSVNMKKIENVYVKLSEEQDSGSNRIYPFEVCNKDDEGAMTISDYMKLKYWYIKE